MGTCLGQPNVSSAFIQDVLIIKRVALHRVVPARDFNLRPQRGVVAEHVPASTHSHALAYVAGGKVVQHAETQLVW